MMTHLYSKAAMISMLLLSVGAGALSAAQMTGGFGTTSAGVMTYADAGNTTHKIDFCPPDPSSPAIGTGSCAVGGPTPGQGLTQVQGGTGTFASIIAPVAGTILDMVDQPGNAPFTFFPVGVPNLTINNYITISSFATFNFQANQFVNQTCAPSATTVCIGGFILTQVANNVSVSFTVQGTAFGPGFDPTPFTDVISGQFNNTTTGAVAGAAQTPGVIFSNTWSGSVTMNPVPEPATRDTLLTGGLLLLVSFVMRKRFAQNS